MTTLKREVVFTEIEKLMIDYCQDCFLYKHNREEKGRCSAHRFCITNCTVGEEIKKLGSKLS